MRMGDQGVKSANQLYEENTLRNRYPKDTTLKNTQVHTAAKPASVKNCQQRHSRKLE